MAGRVSLRLAIALVPVAVFLVATPLPVAAFPLETPLRQAPLDQTCATPAKDYSPGGSPLSSAPNDPLFDRQWGLRQIDAPGAWTESRGAGVVVAVIDSGVDLSHPDLRPKLVRGKDFADEGGCPGPQDEGSQVGHGTAVAGIIAAATDNGAGIAGVAPAAKIMPLKVFGQQGLDMTDVVAAIRHAADRGADVVSLALGRADVVESRQESANRDLIDAVGYAWEKGLVVVAASDNSSFPTCNYPAAARYAICVAATDSQGLPASYASLPFRVDEGVAVRAPGGRSLDGAVTCESDENVWATTRPSIRDCGIAGYQPVAGSSFAAPHVAGVAALLVAEGLTNEEVLDCLRATSSNSGTYEPVMGYGIVDAGRAVSECPR